MCISIPELRARFYHEDVALLVFLVLAAAAAAQPVTFYRDVLPILQNRCQECHRQGQAAPMPFSTYQETRPWAKAIRQAVVSKKMPPWFGDPCCGKFSNDRSLEKSEIATLAEWSQQGAPRGSEADAPPPRAWTQGWNIPRPDLVVSPPQSFRVPAKGAVEYQYFVADPRFSQDQWVSAVEVRPGNAAVVHHAVVYIREPGDTWTRGPTKADILAVYAPGTAPDVFLPGMAKFIPAGADLILEIHYTPNGKPAEDRTSIGMVFAKTPPSQRVLTLQMNQTTFRIPAGQKDYRVSVWGTLPNDALLLGLFPHMHLRGKAFEFTRVLENGQPDTLLRVSPYDFSWQLWYRLQAPLPLKKGTRLNWIATYDNSAANPRNPDPTADVTYGFQSWEEMMIGFFDVAVDAHVDKKAFFVRQE